MALVGSPGNIHRKKEHLHKYCGFFTDMQGWIYWRGAAGGGGCAPLLALARRGAGGAIFHDKAKNY